MRANSSGFSALICVLAKPASTARHRTALSAGAGSVAAVGERFRMVGPSTWLLRHGGDALLQLRRGTGALRRCPLDQLPEPVLPHERWVLDAVRAHALPAISTYGC